MSNTISPNTNAKVLVTGANGYIAVWIVQTLLEKGYSVRGTVRSVDKGTYLKKIFSKYGAKFELAIVEDITKEGAFDESVKGVDAIAHTSSPFHMNAKDPNELIEPAVKGTLSVLESALKYGTSVKRIVVTSSTVAVLELSAAAKVFTEEDWNNQSVGEVEKHGVNANPFHKYNASKTLAERAAWDFFEKHKANIKWDLSVLNPPFVFGPPIHEVKDLASVNTSVAVFYRNVVQENSSGASKEELTIGGFGYVDVRDLADAHVLALEKQAAGGERIIINGGNYVFQEFIDIANALSPSPIPSHTLPKGFPGSTLQNRVGFRSIKEEKILGLKMRTKLETTRDSLADFHARGW